MFQQPIEPELLRAAELAVALNCSRATAYNLMARREVPVITFGKSVRVPKDALKKWMAERTELGA